MGYIQFKFNSNYHLHILHHKNIDLFSKSKFAYKLLIKLEDFIIVYRNSFYHTQKFQKWHNNKTIKLKSYNLKSLEMAS